MCKALEQSTGRTRNPKIWVSVPVLSVNSWIIQSAILGFGFFIYKMKVKNYWSLISFLKINPQIILQLSPYSLFFLRFYLFIFRERGRDGERDEEKHQCVRETSTDWSRLACLQPGTWPTTQACTVTRNRTGDLLVSRPNQSPEPHQPGQPRLFKSQHGLAPSSVPNSHYNFGDKFKIFTENQIHLVHQHCKFLDCRHTLYSQHLTQCLAHGNP